MRTRLMIAVPIFMAGLWIIAMQPTSAGAVEPSSDVPRTAERLATGQPVTIVCLGDSVTGVYYHTGGRRAYPEMVEIGLRKAYSDAKVQVINAGVSGNSTVDGLNRLQTDVLAHHPNLVTVMFGLNDMVRVPLPEFRSNLKTIIEKCTEIGAEVLLCTPNAVIDTEGRPTSKLVEYCDAMKAVGKDLGVPVSDCYAAHADVRAKDPLAWRLMLSDPFHPNMDGHILNAVTICRSITGREVSLDDVPPPDPALPKTRARLEANEPVRILAMPPYDEIVAAAFRAIAPPARLEVVPWPTEGQTLAQLEEASKTVRQRATDLDLVVIAVPLSVTPGETPPDEASIASYTWILNWSLSFGHQEWDVIAIAPSVLDKELNGAEIAAEKFARHLIKAQHLDLVAREPGDDASTAELVERWLKQHLPRQ